MAKRIVDIWDENGELEVKLETIEGMALHGYSIEQIAKALGITKQTMLNMKNPKNVLYDMRVAEALRRGNEDLYFKCISFQRHVLDDPDTPVEIRLQLAQKFINKYDKRFLLDIDKDIEKEANGNDTEKRVFVVLGDAENALRGREYGQEVEGEEDAEE